ncbi:kinase-like protein [Fistulina hepatica ATCC 64428]|uniref:non-specific serine/threonine protein kinase n=1 Tax=Fistulina hepatica ATCC 64428 TaxID=1128425 RepID=A0A0D7AA52_9AGAR|nr:kinase-like protein [Fistulina hepatica ATCC 64428]
MASTSTLLRSIIIRSTDQLVEDDPEWQPILHAPNQIVLYNPTSHALTIRPSTELLHRRLCPYCRRLLPLDFRQPFDEEMGTLDEDALSDDEMPHARAPDYFRLLAVANETYSRPTTPPSIAPEDNGSGSNPPAFTSVNMAQGYFEMFFEVECKLGMGANGSVFLCQHILDGNRLGHFAVKKVAVGESHSYLLNILKEVRLLETLQHPNIITYHHAWLETSQFSSFGPRIPTLHVLMQWAEGGSLDDLIDVRQGKSSRLHIFHPADPTHHVDTPVAERESSPIPDNIDQLSRSARVRAFRAFQRASPSERERIRKQSDAWKAVHLFSAEEVHSLFSDIVAGLSFLHSRSILHLDLKPANILLTWVEGRMTPRAMLSDFGTSRDMLNTAALRSGNTGTLEYASPESLPSLQTGELRRIDSKSDMWSFGMVLHKLLFFRLPYRHSSDEDGSRVPENEKMDRLEREVREYPGFKSSSDLVAVFTSRHLPSSYLVLLESLLNPSVVQRPSIEKVSKANMEGKVRDSH